MGGGAVRGGGGQVAPPPGRPWAGVRVPAAGTGEALVALPRSVAVWDPPPYAARGAPYGGGGVPGPWYLRRGVAARLEAAQEALGREVPGLRLKVFDAFRPLAVQAFMVEATFEELAGVPRAEASEAVREETMARVLAFWAPPSPDPRTPPPHATGSAVDVTLVDERDGGPGAEVAMGSAVDELGDVAFPDHFAHAAEGTPEAAFHAHRTLLRRVMRSAGFEGHPREWWHFSHGDQLWAWATGASEATYGRVEP